MNFLANVLSDDFIRALGWTLIHSLWQGAVVALLYGATMLVLKKASSRLRYRLSLIALMIIPVMFLLTFISIYPEKEAITTSNAETISVITGPVDAELIKTYLTEGHPAGFFKDLFYTSILYFEKYMPLFVLLWMMGLMVFSIRFLGGLAYTQRLKHHKTYAVSKEWELHLKQISQKMKVSRPVKMVESAIIKMPMVIGFFKPVILMPLGALSNIPADQLEAIISHELAHVLRKDYIINIIQSVIELFFFFHPAVWWISKNIRIEREYKCDDLTLKFYDDPLIYVKALANINEMETNNEFGRFATAFSNGKEQLLDRIQRMINTPRKKSSFPEGVVLIIFLVFSVLAISTTAAISLREENYDPFLKNNQTKHTSINHPGSEQSLNLEINPLVEKNDQFSIAPVFIPDTLDKEKEAEHERIKKQYEQALKLKQEAEYEMQKAITEQQEAMEEYRKAVREQREVILEQHRAAREEYHQKLKDIYKNDTLGSHYDGFIEDFEFDTDWDFDFDKEAFNSQLEMWSLDENNNNLFFYSKPGVWTVFCDSLADFGDIYFDEGNFHYQYDNYMDKIYEHNDLLEDELMIIDEQIRALDLDYEQLVLENMPRIEDLAFFDEDVYPRGVYVPHGNIGFYPDKPDLDMIYNPFKIEKIVKSELLKDGLIKRGGDYIIKINPKSMIINGEKQPRDVYKKYKRLLESATGDEIEDGRTFMY